MVKTNTKVKWTPRRYVCGGEGCMQVPYIHILNTSHNSHLLSSPTSASEGVIHAFSVSAFAVDGLRLDTTYDSPTSGRGLLTAQ